MDAILFDVDGTILDSLGVWNEVVQAIYDANHIDSNVEEDMKRYHSLKASEAFAWIHAHWHTKMDEKDMEELADTILERAYTKTIQPLPGAVEFIKLAKKKGYRLGVVTSSPLRLLKPCFQRLGIFEDFDGIESAEDLGLSKRNPEIFERALKALHVRAKDTYYFEDSRYALDTADGLGIVGIGVRSKGEKYPDRAAIDDFVELLPLLKSNKSLISSIK